jgi:hypothetical protein
MSDDNNFYYDDQRNAMDRRFFSPPPMPAAAPPRMQTAFLAPQQRPFYYQPMPMPAPQPAQPAPPAPAPMASPFAKLTTGQVIEMGSAAFAALQPLPVAPVATKDTATDVNNLMLYQAALAQHAKRDEQFRTLGTLIARLLG